MKEYMKDSNWIWNSCWGAEDKDAPRIVLFRKKIDLEAAPYRGETQISGHETCEDCQFYEQLQYIMDVRTPVGDIKVTWKMENGNFKMDYEMPPGVEVSFGNSEI